MTARAPLCALLALGALALAGCGNDKPPGSDLEIQTIATGLDTPWSIDWLPDGRALVTERPGQVRLLTKDGKLQQEPVGFVKIVADAAHNEILGAHMIGPDVTELLPVLTLAQKWDLTADEVSRNVFAHPTLSESVKEAIEGIAGHMINL